MFMELFTIYWYLEYIQKLKKLHDQKAHLILIKQPVPAIRNSNNTGLKLPYKTFIFSGVQVAL